MKRFDFIFFISTIVSAVICFFTGEFLISLMNQSISDYLLIGLYFAVIAFILIIFMHIIIFFISPIKDYLPSKKVFGKSLVFLSLIGFLISFILGSVFQYIYSIASRKISKISNYVVCIDNSGSMSSSDPNYKRYDALKELFKEVDKKQTFSVYVFNNDYELAMPSKKILKDDIANFDILFENYKYSSGGTEVMNMLSKIYQDVEDGALSKNTSVIVISDGECSVDISVLQKLNSKNIAVNTIGFFDNQYGFDSLKEIANETNGSYYYIENVSGVINSLRDITNKYFDQILIGPRENENRNSILYMFLRTLFLFLIILFIKLVQSIIIDISYVRKELLLQSFLFAIIGAILTEILFLNIDLEEEVIRFIMLFLTSFLILRIEIDQPKKIDSMFTEYTSLDISEQVNNYKSKLK